MDDELDNTNSGPLIILFMFICIVGGIVGCYMMTNDARIQQEIELCQYEIGPCGVEKCLSEIDYDKKVRKNQAIEFYKICVIKEYSHEGQRK